MDYKSMLVSLWMPFFVLLALNPGSSHQANTTDNRDTSEATTVSIPKLLNKITEMKEKISSSRNETLYDKEVLRNPSKTTPLKGQKGNIIERKQRNVIKMSFQPSTEPPLRALPVTQLLPTQEIILKKTTTTTKTTNPTATETTPTTETFAITTREIASYPNRSIKTELLAVMNENFTMKKEDYSNPLAQGTEFSLTARVKNTLQVPDMPTTTATTTTTNRTIITTTTMKTIVPPLRSPKGKIKTQDERVELETPIVFTIAGEEAFRKSENKTKTKTQLSNLNNANGNVMKNSQRDKIGWNSVATENITLWASNLTPQHSSNSKHFHSIKRAQKQQEIVKGNRSYNGDANISSLYGDCLNNGCVMVKDDETKQLITGKLLANETYKKTTTSTSSPTFITEIQSSTSTSTPPSPLISTVTSTSTTTTTAKSTTEMQNVIVTSTTIRPPPTIDDIRTVVSQAGTHAYLPCNVKQLVKKPISWLRVRDGHILTVDQTTFIADQRFQPIYTPEPERWSLQIKYVQPKDAGTYECQVSTEPKSSAIVNLLIVEPKTEIVGGSTRHVKAGSQVKLRCIISQALEPPLFINWFYNQKQIYLHNHKGWYTEIERIDLPPETTTTTTTTTTSTMATTPAAEATQTTTTTTKTPTKFRQTTQTIQVTTLPEVISPMTTLTSEGGEHYNNNADISGSEVAAAGALPTSKSTMTTGATETYFSSSTRFSISAIGTVTSTIPSIGGIPIQMEDLRVPPIMTTIATAASLIIPSVIKRDSGNYTCSPSNSAQKTIVLHVLNGEYSASAITSGCRSCIIMSYNRLSQWPHGIIDVLPMLCLIKIYVTTWSLY